MSSSEIAVSVRGLGKSYTIAHKAPDAPNTLAESVLQRLRHPLRRTPKETFWALKDVSFDIKAGEVVGVVGRNGAGKSTLLKVLSQITEPTTGYVDLAGRVGSLLEVGTGFHGELTGRENVFLNGAILGMSRAEIKKQFDAIVDFAGVERFLDTPVKRYSSGMYVRLAFAVAAHLNSDILIVDEVLAVGDAEFQSKCMGRMREVSKGGNKTVLFVSHNIAAISSMCDRCIYLQQGRMVLAADTPTVIARYLDEAGTVGEARFDTAKNNNPVVFAGVSIINDAGETSGTVAVNQDFRARLNVDCRERTSGVELTVRVDNASGQPIFTTNLSDSTGKLPAFERGQHEFDITIPGNFLVPSRYSITVGAHRPGMQVYDLHTHALGFEVEEVGSNMARYQNSNFGVVLVNLKWTAAEPVPA